MRQFNLLLGKKFDFNEIYRYKQNLDDTCATVEESFRKISEMDASEQLPSPISDHLDLPGP